MPYIPGQRVNSHTQLLEYPWFQHPWFQLKIPSTISGNRKYCVDSQLISEQKWASLQSCYYLIPSFNMHVIILLLYRVRI